MLRAFHFVPQVVIATTEEEQRELGMVNNRVFEALACGAAVVVIQRKGSAALLAEANLIRLVSSAGLTVQNFSVFSQAVGSGSGNCYQSCESVMRVSVSLTTHRVGKEARHRSTFAQKQCKPC